MSEQRRPKDIGFSRPANRTLVAAAAVVIQICLGSIYAWSVFLGPLMAEFGWTKTATSLTFTFVLLAYAAGMVFGGNWQDRLGPKWVVTVGGILVGVGYILASRVTSLWQLYLSYGLLAGLGVGVGYGGPVSACLKWFPDKRGLMTGVAVAGFGSGALLFAPIATWMIGLWGWRTTFAALGLLLFGIVMMGGRFLSDPPPDWEPITGKGKPTRKSAVPNIPWKSAVRTNTFWLLWLTFMLSASAGLMVIGHLVSILGEKGVSAEGAALAVGALAAANGGSRIGWGALSDRLGRVQVLRLVFFVLSAVMLVFPYVHSPLMLTVAAGVVGLGFGGTLSLFPTLTAEFFGLKYVGTNYGLLFTAYGIAGVLGPSLGARISDGTGSYMLAFNILAALCLVGFAVSLAIKRPLD